MPQRIVLIGGDTLSAPILLPAGDLAAKGALKIMRDKLGRTLNKTACGITMQSATRVLAARCWRLPWPTPVSVLRSGSVVLTLPWPSDEREQIDAVTQRK